MPVPARVIRDDAMPARIALLHILHMAAEGSRAAVADRCEGLSLLGAEDVSPLSEEILFVRAEYIGHFGPMFVHRFGGMSFVARTRSSEPSISSGLLVERKARRSHADSTAERARYFPVDRRAEIVGIGASLAIVAVGNFRSEE